MRLSSLALLAIGGLTSTTNALSLPHCGQTCLSALLAAIQGCDVSDASCACENRGFRADYLNCAIDGCNAADYPKAVEYFDGICPAPGRVQRPKADLRRDAPFPTITAKPHLDGLVAELYARQFSGTAGGATGGYDYGSSSSSFDYNSYLSSASEMMANSSFSFNPSSSASFSFSNSGGSSSGSSSSSTSGSSGGSGVNVVAIAVGVAVPVIVLIIAGVVLFCFLSKRKKNQRLQQQQQMQAMQMQQPGAGPGGYGAGSELPGAGVAYTPVPGQPPPQQAPPPNMQYQQYPQGSELDNTQIQQSQQQQAPPYDFKTDANKPPELLGNQIMPGPAGPYAGYAGAGGYAPQQQQQLQPLPQGKTEMEGSSQFTSPSGTYATPSAITTPSQTVSPTSPPPTHSELSGTPAQPYQAYSQPMQSELPATSAEQGSTQQASTQQGSTQQGVVQQGGYTAYQTY